MRYIFQGTYQSGNGNVIASGTVSVYLAGTTTAASIYTASSGGTAVNSVTTDGAGYFEFYVDDTDYNTTQLFDITLTKTHFISQTYENIKIIPYSAFARTLVDDTTAGEFLTTLGVSSFAQSLLDDATAGAARTTLGLGTAAVVDTGTDPGDVPLNSDLATAILLDEDDFSSNSATKAPTQQSTKAYMLGAAKTFTAKQSFSVALDSDAPIVSINSSTSGRGVYGSASAATGTTYGVYGTAASAAGFGVFGYSTFGTAVKGQSTSTSGYGVYGHGSAVSGVNYGVYGVSDSVSGTGVFGTAAGYGVNGYSVTGTGVKGQSGYTTGRGVYGYASSSSGTNYGVLGESASASGYDFYASGSGINYGPFTGSHDALIIKEAQFEIGDIMVDKKIIAKRNISNCIAEIELSSSPAQKAVIGVITNMGTPLDASNMPAAMSEIAPEDFNDAADIYNRTGINALGEGQVNVCNEGGGIEAGDFICSSSTPGKGMRQPDDTIHNYTVAKARESVTWSPGDDSIKQIACVYLCG